MVTDPISLVSYQVKSILDLHDLNTKIYEAHYGLTQEWANQLLAAPFLFPTSLPLSYDRLAGTVDQTLGELSAEPAGGAFDSFRFVLNNTVTMDNRIPTWGMRYDDALVRNALPVPADQYGDPGAGGAYQHWDEVALDPPVGAVRGEVELLYQTTSWEYIQFLWLANDGSIAFLADEGDNMLSAWLNTGMSEPYTMATITVREPNEGVLLMAGAVLLIAMQRRRGCRQSG